MEASQSHQQQIHQESEDQQENNFHDHILSQLPIELTEEEIQILDENGFDDLESLKFLSVNTLKNLGIEDPEQVFEAVQELIMNYQQYQMNNQNEVEEENEEGEEGYYGQEGKQGEGQINEGPLNIETPKALKPITTKLIVQTLQSQTQKLSSSAALQQTKTFMGSQLSQTLSKLTHLHLNGKRIQIIGEEMEKACKNLKVLYLFDNQIQRIEGLTSMRNLIQLSLYNNQIAKMEGLESLVALRRLYLEKNHISRLEGLTSCRSLEELYLQQQDIQTDFTFDDYSLAAISGSLKYLDLSDSRVVDSQPLYYLERLEVLILKKNRIIDFEGQICPMLQTMNSLAKLDLSENPVNQIQKYRDQIVILTGNRLQEIDGKKVTQQERTYLMQLVQRKQRHVIGGGKEENKKQPGAGFEIQGKNKTLHANEQMGGGLHMMAGTGGLGEGGDDTQNKFYSPLDEAKMSGNVLKTRTNIANPSFQNNANVKKRSVNINANNDFTAAGLSHMPTKHIPMMKK